MFTLDQVKAAHIRVKSGADFPAYVQELIRLGVAGYDIFVSDGHADYYDRNDVHRTSEPKYAALDVAADSDGAAFKKYLKLHQQGGSDYSTFCRHSAETGVEKWRVDTAAMTCTYYDQAGNEMLVEQIPSS